MLLHYKVVQFRRHIIYAERIERVNDLERPRIITDLSLSRQVDAPKLKRVEGDADSGIQQNLLGLIDFAGIHQSIDQVGHEAEREIFRRIKQQLPCDFEDGLLLLLVDRSIIRAAFVLNLAKAELKSPLNELSVHSDLVLN